jgi:hypothetical protein
MSQVSTILRQPSAQVLSTTNTGWVVGCADPDADSAVIATPSPAPSGAMSDKENALPRSAVPAGMAISPDAPGRSTHAATLSLRRLG